MAGEQFAFILVKELTGKLSSELWDELGLLWNFKDDLDNIKSNLLAIQTVLSDADTKSIDNGPIRHWLNKLKAAAYDMEDMLNYFAQKKTEGTKVQRFFSSKNWLVFRGTMAHKMKKMRKRLQKISDEKNNYALSVSVTDKQKETEKRKTFSRVEETEVLGREEEKKEMIRRMLAVSKKTDVSIISIVGIGGLGKTTLAKLIFNDVSMSHFNLKIWLHAMEFDVHKLANAIITQSRSGERYDSNDLESTSKCIENSLRGKRYLIVLDDVWNEDSDKWDDLKLMLQGGNNGSIVLVTTRSLEIASMMAAESRHSLKYLSDDDCWKLFKQRAFRPGGVETEPNFVKLGKEIVNKCGGVPLAAKALGGILGRETGEEAWKDVRDNGIWGIDQQYEKGQPCENKIMATLKVSYQYMPSPIKACFIYCSIYPKAFDLEKEKLIQQWIAQGFIHSERESKSLEIGEKYVNYLESISFLQDRKVYHEKTKRVTYKMHDLVYDLARSIAGNEVLIIEAGNEATTSVQECRYASLSGYEDKDSPELQQALPKKARALHFRGCTLSSLPDSIFSQTRCVRVLDLNGCFIDELPTSIIQLKQLRYLDASHRPIHNLDAIVNFQNLEMLNLLDCPINQVPSTICQLQKLYCLNLSGCLNISTLPYSIGELHRLLYLDLSGCHQLRELPEPIWSLKNLSSLNLGGCSSLQTLHQSLGKLERLKLLDLSDCASLTELPESVGELLNLQLLDLSDCDSLSKLPQSIGNLENLQTLILRNCQLIEVLPETLSNLTNLETLDLGNCKLLNQLHRSIGNLESLKLLHLSNCDALSELPESVANLVNLETLDLQGCSSLDRMPSKIGRLTKLQVLCKFIVDYTVGKGYRSRGCNIAELKHLELLTGDLEIIFKCVVDPDDAKRANLKEKEIRSLTLCWDYFWRKSGDHTAILEQLVPHQNLKILSIKGFLGVKFPSWMMEETAKFLPNLVEIELLHMSNSVCVPVLGQLPYLRKIKLGSMPKIMSISTKELCGGDRATSFRSLEELVLEDMRNLQEWVTADDSYNGGGGSCCFFPSLRRLFIEKCPMLRIRPRIPPSVMRLTLNRCSKALEESAEVNTWKQAHPDHIHIVK